MADGNGRVTGRMVRRLNDTHLKESAECPMVVPIWS